MDPQLFLVFKEGNIDMLKTLMQEQPSCLQGITAEKNTPLHLAAGLGYGSCVTEILNRHEELTFSVNSRGDTPLHCAARGGHDSVVRVLIRHVQYKNADLCEMRNECGNTPLHEAVKQCHASTSKVLMHEEWRLGQIVNEHGESAVYLAAERGELEIVRMLLQFSACAVGGPDQQTALHAAVCRNSEIAELLMKNLPLISHQVDASESSPLHYAASFGDHKMIQLLLRHDASTAYLLDKDGLSAIHVAATMGYIEVIAEIIKHCPDTIELTDKKQRNFLHVAIENKQLKVVKYVLQNPALLELINAMDQEGNTPLHLATLMHNLEIVNLLLADERIDTRSRNYKGLAPLDLASLSVNSSISVRMHKIMKRLMSAGSQFSPQRMDLMTKNFYREDAEEINRYRALSNNLAIVAVLIATVTFAAAFTLPGGYENDGPNRGMAILGKKTTFKAFLISDALAMVSSIIVTCLLIYTGSSDHDVRLHSIRIAMKLMWVALGGMVVAFAMGIYVVVESGCKWISVLICFMACSVPFIAWMIAYWPAFDSLNLVKTRRNQDKKRKETPLLEPLGFRIPSSMIGYFSTPYRRQPIEF